MKCVDMRNSRVMTQACMGKSRAINEEVYGKSRATNQVYGEEPSDASVLKYGKVSN